MLLIVGISYSPSKVIWDFSFGFFPWGVRFNIFLGISLCFESCISMKSIKLILTAAFEDCCSCFLRVVIPALVIRGLFVISDMVYSCSYDALISVSESIDSRRLNSGGTWSIFILNKKVLPWFTPAEYTLKAPSNYFTSYWQIIRPKPIPSEFISEVLCSLPNFLNNFFYSSCSIPSPVSYTCITKAF